MSDRGYLLTEQANANSWNLDQLSPLALVDLFVQEDSKTVAAIAQTREALAAAIHTTSNAICQGGRLFYVGAGTSGRLGVLDAAECPPTFCTPPEMVQGILAGGEAALVRSSENLEDRYEDGAAAIEEREIDSQDVVVGITAGGTTPYVWGALEAARKASASTIFMTCVPPEQASSPADLDIRLLVGPEIVAGSTRLKAGTATKMALNILSTGVMVRLGKVYGNRMVDVAATNEKLRDRALRILMDLTELERSQAASLLANSNNSVKLALLRHWKGISLPDAQTLLQQHQGHLRRALQAEKEI